MATHGVTNMLKEFGVLPGDICTPEMQGRKPTIVAAVPHADCYVMAEDSGIYEPLVDLGDGLCSGQLLGRIHYPDNLDKAPLEVTCPMDGFLLCKRAPGKTQRGDNIAIVAQAVS